MGASQSAPAPREAPTASVIKQSVREMERVVTKLESDCQSKDMRLKELDNRIAKYTALKNQAQAEYNECVSFLSTARLNSQTQTQTYATVVGRSTTNKRGSARPRTNSSAARTNQQQLGGYPNQANNNQL